MTFRDGERVLGTAPLDQTGQARISVADLTAGEHDIRADYTGDANFAASTGTVHQTVGRATTKTTVAHSAVSAVSGAAVAFAATVSVDVVGTPTGSMTFRDGATVLGTADLDPAGIARFAADPTGAATPSPPTTAATKSSPRASRP